MLLLNFLFLLLFFFYCTIYNPLTTINNGIKFPWKICNKAAANIHYAVQCDKCNIWLHTKCNKVNPQTYTFLQKSPLVWYYIKYFEDIVAFGTTSDEKLFKINQGSKLKFTFLTKNQTSPTKDLINQLNEARY